MATMESFIHSMSRFVFGLGVGLALTSVYVIVTAPDLAGTKAAAGDIVLLDPVVVTISAEHYDAIRAEAAPVSKTVHLFGAGPQAV